MSVPSESAVRRPPGPLVIVRYAVAVSSVAVALGVALVLDHRLSGAPVSLFLCAIMFTAWFGGLIPGLVSVVLCHLAFLYYFVPPIHSFVPEIRELPRVLLFSLSALFVASLSAAPRSGTDSLGGITAAAAREARQRG